MAVLFFTFQLKCVAHRQVWGVLSPAQCSPDAMHPLQLHQAPQPGTRGSQQSHKSCTPGHTPGSPGPSSWDRSKTLKHDSPSRTNLKARGTSGEAWASCTERQPTGRCSWASLCMVHQSNSSCTLIRLPQGSPKKWSHPTPLTSFISTSSSHIQHFIILHSLNCPKPQHFSYFDCCGLVVFQNQMFYFSFPMDFLLNYYSHHKFISRHFIYNLMLQGFQLT